MVPGPWFPEIAAAARADPALDIGIHLTLTSEWDSCRWAPISTTSRTSGLIDPEGYFWRDVAQLRQHMDPFAAEAELRAQITRALEAGMRPTHLDAHMAAAMLPELLDAHIRLAHEFGLMPILPRSIRWAPDPVAYRSALARLDAQDAPVIDHCRGTIPVPADDLAAAWHTAIATIEPGITHLALHCTIPGEFDAMAPDHAAWRTAEYALIAAGTLRDHCAEAGIAVLGTRALQSAWLKAAAKLPARKP